jgi:uncharacterized protein (DUF983 family)
MAVSYVERGCPDCNKISIFQVFASFTGRLERCMECGYEKSEMEDLEIPTPWEIINN